MRNIKREVKLLGRVKCHGNTTNCKREHSINSKLTPKGTKPVKKEKKVYK